MSSRWQRLVRDWLAYIDEFDPIVAFERLAGFELKFLVELLGYGLFAEVASVFTGFDNLLA